MADIDNVLTNAVLEGSATLGTFSGRLETQGDHDWVRVDLVAGQTYKFYLSFLQDGSATEGDAFLTLRNASGIAQAFANDGGVGTNSLLSFTPSDTGTYFIDISEASAGATGNYGLFVSLAGAQDELLTTNNDNHVGDTDERSIGGVGDDTITVTDGRDALGEQGNQQSLPVRGVRPNPRT